ncbi:hypothetical protein ES705_32687 [subsurface metagenome]
MMSQINHKSSRNLYEFGDYMKKQLTFTLILAVMSVIVTFLDFSIDIFLLLVMAIALIIIALIVIIFEIMMLVRLNRAKDASPHPNLVKTYQFFLANILLGIVGIFISEPVYALTINVASLIVVLIAWKSLAEYVEIYRKESPASPGFQLVAEGIKMYTISVYLSLGMLVVSFIMGFSYNLGLMIGLGIISFIIAIFSIVASYKLANGMMAVFGAPIPSGSPSPSPSMYGNTAPQFISHIPDNSSQYGAPASEPATTIQTTNMGQNFCNQCGGIVDPEAKFCGVCG